MHTFWQASWDFFFPPTPDERRVATTQECDLQDLYQPQQRHSHLTLTSYRHDLVRSLVTTNKFSANRRAARLLSTLLDTYLRTQPEPVTLVPIPLSRARYKQRGHNQTTSVLRQLRSRPHERSHEIRILLQRIRDTAPQTSCDRKKRRQNVHGAFASAWRLRSIRPTIFIVDDVATTGHTLREAKRTLKHIYPTHDIYTVALARST